MNVNLIKKIKAQKIQTDIQTSLVNFTHNNAIDIVLNIIESEPEDVCKWNKSTVSNLWYSECQNKNLSIPLGNSTQIYFEYCPFCGKKIERI